MMISFAQVQVRSSTRTRLDYGFARSAELPFADRLTNGRLTKWHDGYACDLQRSLALIRQRYVTRHTCSSGTAFNRSDWLWAVQITKMTEGEPLRFSAKGCTRTGALTLKATPFSIAAASPAMSVPALR